MQSKNNGRIYGFEDPLYMTMFSFIFLLLSGGWQMNEKTMKDEKNTALDLNPSSALWASDLSFLICKMKITFLW